MIERRAARNGAPYNGAERRAFNRSAMPSYANHDQHTDNQLEVGLHVNAASGQTQIRFEENAYALPQKKAPTFTA